ncbi:MAG: DedA family protein [Gemmataceae bacterium]|nr:DedA family protein [Gemmataceae bacterium]
MLEYFTEFGYVGIFALLVLSGLGLPIPEEIPVVIAGAMVGHEDTRFKWYVMLPVVMAGVVIGDGFLYAIGRVWGTWLLSRPWVQRRLVPPEKRAEIEKNFHDRGIAVLLGARLLPGIRTPIFLMAGVLRVPLGRFLLADGLYAIPGVNLLFWLAYLLTDQMIQVVNKLEEYRPLVMVSILSAVAGALFQKYVLTRKVSTGEPPHVPPVIAKPAGAVAHAVEVAVEKAAGAVAHAAHLGRSAERPMPSAEKKPDGADPDGGAA